MQNEIAKKEIRERLLEKRHSVFKRKNQVWLTLTYHFVRKCL